MDKEKELKTIIGVIIVIAVIWISQNYTAINNLEEEKAGIEAQVEECEYKVIDYQGALEEANNNIEDANSQIEEAQEYAWSSYDDMGYVLDDLYTVETIDKP
jgi:peptidoglycan hydrolase CwlO-like protein